MQDERSAAGALGGEAILSAMRSVMLEEINYLLLAASPGPARAMPRRSPATTSAS
jgi:hypothetical protein